MDDDHWLQSDNDIKAESTPVPDKTQCITTNASAPAPITKVENAVETSRQIMTATATIKPKKQAKTIKKNAKKQAKCNKLKSTAVAKKIQLKKHIKLLENITETDPKEKSIVSKRTNRNNADRQCEICGAVTKNLTIHMLVHTDEKNFECDMCGKKFNQK